uniref:ATP-dependent DNA helicase n=1 Tax=Strongyloides venezuelensis TaxID=75913 RepID=A0A0K0EWL2_STRVS
MSYYKSSSARRRTSSSFSDENDGCKELGEKLMSEEFRNLDIPGKADYLLHNVFKLEDFRTIEQKEAIYNAMKERGDTYICFPTGAGKSLCYQLPALSRSGVTIVFSPLIALMEDQVNYLRSLNIKCCAWNSNLSDEERSNICKDLIGDKPPRHRIVYTSPESINNNFFCKIVKKLGSFGRLNFFVVDEAHCISYWGHEFRSDYLKLSRIRSLCYNVPWIILTATANPETEASILRSLQCNTFMKGALKIFKTTPRRKNLFYDVFFEEAFKEGETLQKHISEYIKLITRVLKVRHGENFDDFAGIVYCRTIDSCTKMARFLSDNGLPSAAYHSQLSADEKKSVQDLWMRNELTAVCATIAFGMGINKSNVRFIVHHFPPDNLAAYYQESGRAGRDGEESYCRLYYSQKIKKKMTVFLKEKLKEIEGEEAKEEIKEIRRNSAVDNYKKMIEYCESTGCRNQALCKFFQPSECIDDCKDHCDACKHGQILKARLKMFRDYVPNSKKKRISSTTLKKAPCASDVDTSDDNDTGHPAAKKMRLAVDE